jgi:hypothetical protein
MPFTFVNFKSDFDFFHFIFGSGNMHSFKARQKQFQDNGGMDSTWRMFCEPAVSRAYFFLMDRKIATFSRRKEVYEATKNKN